MRIPTIKSRKHQSPLDLAIVELDSISLKTANLLEKANVFTVRDYLNTPTSVLAEIRNFGPKSFEEMAIALRAVGVKEEMV